LFHYFFKKHHNHPSDLKALQSNLPSPRKLKPTVKSRAKTVSNEFQSISDNNIVKSNKSDLKNYITTAPAHIIDNQNTNFKKLQFNATNNPTTESTNQSSSTNLGLLASDSEYDLFLNNANDQILADKGML